MPAVLIVILLGLEGVHRQAGASSLTPDSGNESARSATLQAAQRFFYNGQYEAAAVAALALCSGRFADLAACELRTSALLFQIKRALEEEGSVDQTAAWKQCAVCPGLMSAFLAETVRGQTVARARLEIHPEDPEALFLLGKLDLNYVWLQLGTLGRKTGGAFDKRRLD